MNSKLIRRKKAAYHTFKAFHIKKAAFDNNALFNTKMKYTFVEEIITQTTMTYKVKSLMYLVVFVATAFAYHITGDNTETNTYVKTIDIEKVNTIETATSAVQYKK